MADTKGRPSGRGSQAHQLEIRLFGNLELRDGSTVLTEFPTQKAKRLLAFLLLGAGRFHQREVLAGVFWPDRSDAKAKKCLRNELWRLRNSLAALRPKLADILTVRSDAIGIESSSLYRLDIQVFERDVVPQLEARSGPLSRSDIAVLRGAVELYRGDLLEDIYDDWCLYQREAFHLQYLSALELLMRHHLQEAKWDMALLYGQRILAQDPLLEHIHRDVTRIYALMGDRPAALRQYHKCVRLLRKELDVEPMPETMDVYQAIVSSRPEVPADRLFAAPRRQSANRPLVSMRRALASIESARAELIDATQRLETTSDVDDDRVIGC